MRKLKSITNYKLHYKVLGKGKPIIFIHGWNGSLESFERIDFVSELAKKQRVFLIDLPGYGKSPRLKEYSFNTLYKILNHFLKEQKIKKADFFGVCSGSPICADFCIKNPKKVGDLFLVEPCFTFPKSLAWLCPFTKRFRFLGVFLFYAFVKNRFFLRIICNFLLTNKKAIEINQFTRSKAGVSVGYMLGFYDYSKIDHFKRLEKIKNRKEKTIIFIGENTGRDIKETSIKIQKIMKNSKLVKISNSSHFLMDENPKEFRKRFFLELNSTQK